MDIKELSKDYFTKTPEEQEQIILLATRYYIEDMIIAEGNLQILQFHLRVLLERSLEKEDYEVSEVLGSILKGINQVMEEQEESEDGLQL